VRVSYKTGFPAAEKNKKSKL